MVSVEEGASAIWKAIETSFASGNGCLLGRNGSTELQSLFYLDVYSDSNMQTAKGLETYSGIFPASPQNLISWSKEYRNALEKVQSDPIVAGWFSSLVEYEKLLLRGTCPSAVQIPLRSLEPYYVEPEKRWTSLLAGKRVAVVSSFAKTITAQIPKAKDIWGATFESLIPSTTSWIPIQTGFPPQIAKGSVEWAEGCDDWKKAIDWMEKEILDKKVHVCLIGCGALGMILGARLKSHGIVCIVMGGAIQVLFGIKGRRWQSHSVIGNFWNDAWVWPSSEEIPMGARLIEGACYWGNESKQ